MTTVRQRMDLRLSVQMAAPHTWSASLAPVLLTGVLTLRRTGEIDLLLWLCLLAICVLMQSAANIFNDYYDLLRGTDRAGDWVEANDSVLVYNDIPPRQALILGTGCLAADLLLAVYPVLSGGPSVLWVGLTGAVVLLCYSAGPVPLSSLPVGELTSGFAMGCLIPLGCASALTGRLDSTILLDSLPVALGIALMMMTNNACDIERDQRVGRITLPVLLGRPYTRLLYRLLLVGWAGTVTGYMMFRFPLDEAVRWPVLALWLGTAVMAVAALFRQLRLSLEPPCRPVAMKGIARLNGLLALTYILWLLI